MNTIESLRWRYATKKFDPNKSVSKDKLNIITEAFNLTATSFGLQTIKLIVITDTDLRQSLLPYAYGQKQVIDASHLLVLCIEDNIFSYDVDNHFDTVRDVRDTPEDILAPYRKDLKSMMKSKTKTERQQWSTNQAYIALGNLMTVCAIEQIDSCPMEGFLPEKFDEILDLKSKGLKSVLLLPIGYRSDEDFFATLKKVRQPIHKTVLEMN